MSDNIKLAGITSRQIQTERINTHILTSGPPAGIAVLFIHGSSSSAGVWDETMLRLPEGYHGIAPDLRGFGTTETLPVDATLGLGDMVADLRSLVEALGLCPFHIVGHGMGGGVVMKYAIKYAEELLSITLVDTISPYGFGGSKGLDGKPVYDDGAPGGAGSVNPDFIRLLDAKEMGDDDPIAPKNVIRYFYVKPPFVPNREEALLESMLSTVVGDDWYPGNTVESKNWPGSAPGDKGVANAISGKYFDASELTDIPLKPPILWIRGEDDLIVSDRSMWDIATLGAMGLVPDWPGEEECPPQPMLMQIRSVLEQYRQNGGNFRELVIEDAGYMPFIEKPEQFGRYFHAHINAFSVELA
jgi:pimeloyl-ACP methyl ester carboxylesterase